MDQLLVDFLFLATGIVNVTTKFRQHLDRMTAVGVPCAKPLLIAGFAMQFAGGLLIAFDWHRAFGAAILIVFTVLATAIFTRSGAWRIPCAATCTCRSFFPTAASSADCCC